MALDGSDLIVLGLAIITVLAVVLTLVLKYFLPKPTVGGIRQRMPSVGEGSILVFTGSHNGFTPFIAKYLDGEGYHDKMTAVLRDVQTGEVKQLGPLKWGENLKVFEGIGLAQGKVVIRCNVDWNNRPAPWDPMQEKLYEKQIDAIAEERLKEEWQNEYDKVLEQANLRSDLKQTEVKTEILKKQGRDDN